MKNRVLILGIDPGSRITGYGIVEAIGQECRYVSSGCIRTAQGDLAGRLREIYLQVNRLSREFRPAEVAIEGVFVSRNSGSALKLGHARAAAMCATFEFELPVFEYAPRQIKRSVVGTGSAEKEQVQHMIRALLRIDGELQVDAADALAVAVCHAHLRNTQLRLPAGQVPA